MSSFLIPPVGQIQKPVVTLPRAGDPANAGTKPAMDHGNENPEAAQMEEKFMIIVGGLVELLIQKGTISEEELHNAIASLQDGGNDDQENPKGPMKGGENGKKGGSPGYPGPDNGMRNGEPGKYDRD